MLETDWKLNSFLSCQVTIEKTEARLKHFRKISGSEEVNYEKLKLVINRLHGTVSIHNYSNIKSPSTKKAKFGTEELYHCRKAKLTPRANDSSPEFRTNRFQSV